MTDTIDFRCDYEPMQGLYALTVAGRRFVMTPTTFDLARKSLRTAACAASVPSSLALDLGDSPLNLVGARRSDFLALAGIFEAADRAARRQRRAEGN